MDLVVNFLKDTFAFDENSPLLFTQLYFWVFFVAVFAVFSLVHSKVLLRNTFLFFVSVLFYYKTSGWFTLILVFATLFNYIDGLLIYHSKKGWKTAWLVLG
ncbi:MAG: MBOAT family protein, partial [Paludibacteraceae bacterium]|nr:MBOAT family protein [Paludibacteraceae bacterium]